MIRAVETREGTIERAGRRRLAYLDTGDPGAPAVFHLHGTPGSRLGHHPDPAVYEGVRVLSYDRPGYGGSEAVPDRTVADAADDVAAIADALGIERFGVFGVSGGGPHALACAALLPERVIRAAAMVCPAPNVADFDFMAGMSPTNVEEFTLALQGRDALEAALEPAAETFGADPESLIDTLAPELPEPDQAALARPEIRALLVDSFTEAVRQGARGWVDDDLAFVAPWGFELGDIGVETRFWQGALDVLVPRSHGEYLEGKLPQARFELIEGGGHLLFDHWGPVFRWLVEST